MEGIQYIVDQKGKKNAVMIDLNIFGEQWEDIYDILISRARRSEPRVSWKKLKLKSKKDIRTESV
jgi:hypothetical protein